MRWRDDDGIATPVEMMYLLVFCMVAVLFIGYLGRLHTAGVQVTNAAQAAARAASLAPNPSAGAAAAAASVDTRALRLRCQGGASTRVSWVPSPTGSWQGGSVTVVVICVVRNSSLAGVWVPGQRSVIVSDTQPVDRYHR